MIDHLVYATPDVEATAEWVAGRVGVRPAAGGRHPGLGTRNALLGLGGGAYLEIIGIDAGAEGPTDRPRPFALDEIQSPRLAAWAAGATGIDAQADRARAAGYDPGPAFPLSRQLPDGGEVRLRLTFPPTAAVDLVPFLIEWEDPAQHPSGTAAPGCRLVRFTGEHPDPAAVAGQLEALGVDLVVASGSQPVLTAVIEGPGGTVELR